MFIFLSIIAALNVLLIGMAIYANVTADNTDAQAAAAFVTIFAAIVCGGLDILATIIWLISKLF